MVRLRLMAGRERQHSLQFDMRLFCRNHKMIGACSLEFLWKRVQRYKYDEIGHVQYPFGPGKSPGIFCRVNQYLENSVSVWTYANVEIIYIKFFMIECSSVGPAGIICNASW